MRIDESLFELLKCRVVKRVAMKGVAVKALAKAVALVEVLRMLGAWVLRDERSLE